MYRKVILNSAEHKALKAQGWLVHHIAKSGKTRIAYFIQGAA